MSDWFGGVQGGAMPAAVGGDRVCRGLLEDGAHVGGGGSANVVAGEAQVELDFALRRELITDLFVEISVYDSYDSKPPEDGETNDYGIVTSLGYTF